MSVVFLWEDISVPGGPVAYVVGMSGDDRVELMAGVNRRVRERGVVGWVYWPVRVVLTPLLTLFFALRVEDFHQVPRTGRLLIAANHRSFLDAFVIAIAARRPVYFVAKSELFDRPLNRFLLERLGAFPVRRGESDGEVMRTARVLLEREQAVVIFPEGTRVRSGPLGPARRGVGRLAVETGAPVAAVALRGTERVRRGWLVRPARVRVRCVFVHRPAEVASARAALDQAEGLTLRVWEDVERGWRVIGGEPGVPAVRGGSDAPVDPALLVEPVPGYEGRARGWLRAVSGRLVRAARRSG